MLKSARRLTGSLKFAPRASGATCSAAGRFSIRRGCRASLKSPVRDEMFIVTSIKKDASPGGAQCRHYAPSGAEDFIDAGDYKHCAPTELALLSHSVFLNHCRDDFAHRALQLAVVGDGADDGDFAGGVRGDAA